MNRSLLCRAFARYFDIHTADTENRRRAIARLRYQVYCEEFGFEAAERFPEREERDAYDARACHALLWHRPSGRVAGCVRVIPGEPDPRRPNLPMEPSCTAALHDTPLHPGRLPPERVCEVSRLAVHRHFRRRTGEPRTPLGDIDALQFPMVQRRTFPLISASLFTAAAVLSGQLGRDHVFAIMEPRLAHFVARYGLHFRRISDDFEHRGRRAAYYIHRPEVLATIEASRILAPLYRMAEHGLSPKRCANHSAGSCDAAG
ncbi:MULTISPECIES: PEP-CTERM/exosortase system-associated acyltransferase [Halorhodospira]|uniref:PEP-CTERM/exosortase system-associated acyltransferase n=1 Tax=Halorhodospira TaxID=85108 RepID=UPI0019135E60|nr:MULTISPECIES: PEP-CTERM/exosortase system-associated acyltransferase [Halorhodospira]MBK5936137.1 hypothetical protein [Halorhodospira halophila]MCG5537257.1 PEP-CTERM/exosortase system-associated acyltransferase [Halorhodospira sp. 9622]MCG5540179.1 PEP-CTERM/exosortase system-associated acyltransferase [Halorhodospira sp. M39old]MCG5545120.1 PEP-CTERM/exosortase system-associated acyltransferase [Halorhodospira sp. M38]